MSIQYDSSYTYNSGELTYWGATYADEPVLKVEISFTLTNFANIEPLNDEAIPYDTNETYSTGLLYDGTGAFTDVTDYVKQVSISRGKQNLNYESFEAGTAQIELADPDSRFAPARSTGPYYPNVAPMRPVRISAEWSGGLFRLFRGYIDSWDIRWAKEQRITRVNITATDAMKILAKYETEYTGSPDDSPGQRITGLLNDKSWPTAFRDIDLTGHAVTLVQDTADRRSLISTIQDVEFADQGSLYIAADGKVTYRSRANSYPVISGIPDYDWTMSDGAVPGNAVTYRDVSMTVTDETLYNFVSITAVLGVEQTAFNKGSTDAFQEKAFIRTDVLVSDDTQALALAQFILDRDKNALERINSITISPRDSVQNARMAMLSDFFDIVRLSHQYAGLVGASYIVNLYLIGVEHNITPTDWQTTYTTRHQATDETINEANAGVPPKP